MIQLPLGVNECCQNSEQSCQLRWYISEPDRECRAPSTGAASPSSAHCSAAAVRIAGLIDSTYNSGYRPALTDSKSVVNREVYDDVRTSEVGTADADAGALARRRTARLR